MNSFGWAVLGPGRIAHRFAQALQALPGAHLAWVQGRDAPRAAAFAQACSRPGQVPARSTTALSRVLADPTVHGVYIATPHAFHAEAVAACLAAGKPALCEKPLVPSAAIAEPLLALARERGVFLMEAVWTRYLPAYEAVAGWLREGAIGALRGMQSSFCFDAPADPGGRHFDPAQAGGALLDIGLYNLTVTRWVLQQAWGAVPEPQALHASAVMAPSGVDQRLTATLEFPRGLCSQFVCGFDGAADNGFRIFGQHGHIHLPDGFWQAQSATLQRHGEAALTLQRPFATNGFEYEITEAMQCIRAGRIESPRLPHAETLAVLRWMDALRRQIGLRYPFE